MLEIDMTFCLCHMFVVDVMVLTTSTYILGPFMEVMRFPYILELKDYAKGHNQMKYRETCLNQHPTGQK